MLLGPTGKATYTIKGNTIHSALAIPANQSMKNYKQLDSSRLNTLRTQFGGVKLIFIDEISMVGNSMFAIQINNRLKDIKGCKDDFGGVSIIAIGDLFQLEPVQRGGGKGPLPQFTNLKYRESRFTDKKNRFPNHENKKVRYSF